MPKPRLGLDLADGNLLLGGRGQPQRNGPPLGASSGGASSGVSALRTAIASGQTRAGAVPGGGGGGGDRPYSPRVPTSLP